MDGGGYPSQTMKTGSLEFLTCKHEAEIWAYCAHEVATLSVLLTIIPLSYYHQFLSHESDCLGSNPTPLGLRVGQRAMLWGWGDPGCTPRPSQCWAEECPPLSIIRETTEVCLLLLSLADFVNSSHMFPCWLVKENSSVMLCLRPSQSSFPWHLCDPGQMCFQGRAAWPLVHRKSVSE